MDGKIDCNASLLPDHSDEVSSLPFCTTSEFSCYDGKKEDNSSLRCIPREWVRDEDEDCVNGLDEKVRLKQCFNDTEFHCLVDERCIPRYRVLDGTSDCSDGSDEKQPLDCIPSEEFRCRSNGRCVPRSWRGNKMINCPDGSDEMPMMKTEPCVTGEFRCKNNKRCIPQSLLCDGMNHCGDCSDEIEECAEPRMLRCSNDTESKCIHRSYSCDDVVDCPNNADDIISGFGFKCSVSAIPGQRSLHCILPQWTLFDQYSSCDDKSDLCASNASLCTQCVFSNMTISPKQICDGIFDCPDLSDECVCSSGLPSHNRTCLLCENICYGDKSAACKNCNCGQVYCDQQCITRSKVCDGVVDCPTTEIDENFCSASRKRIVAEETDSNFLCDPVDVEFFRAARKLLAQDQINLYLPTTAKK